MLVSYTPSCYLSIWIHMFDGEFVCVLGCLSCSCMSLWMVATAHLTHSFAMMILTSFHSADPSTPTGVRCGKCLWVIHRPAIWAYESTCLLENLCAFLDVYLAFVCLCQWLHQWAFEWVFVPWWSLQVSIRQTLVLPRVYVVENACELYTVLLSEHMNPHVWWRICVRSWMFILRLHVFVNGCKWAFEWVFVPWWSLQVSIRQTLVLPRVYVVENACELYTVLLSEHMNPHVWWSICVRSWMFILRLHVFVNGCNCAFDSLILPWWSLQVSIRQTLVLPRVYVVENACELYTVLLSEHMNPHVWWRICVRSWMFILRLHVFVNGCNCTFDSLFCHDDPYKFPFGRP